MLLPVIMLYAFLPVRVWTDASIAIPGFGAIVLDTLIAMMISLLIVVRLMTIRRGSVPRLSRLWALWALLIVSVLSAIVIGMTGDAAGFKMLLRLFYPILVFMLVLFDYREEADVQRIVSFFIASGVLVTLGVVAATLMGISTWRWSAGVDRFSGLGAVSDYAFVMGMMTVLAYIRMRLGAKKILYGLLAAIFAAQVLMTVTRGAIFATVLALMSVELFWVGRKVSAKVAMVMVLVSLLVGAVTFYEPLRERVFGMHYKDIAAQTNTSVTQKFGESFARSGREGLWAYVFDKISADYHLAFGFGTGTAETNIARDLGGIPHNEYMRVLYETGVVGLLLFLAMFHQIMKIARSVGRDSRDAHLQLLRLCLIGVLVLYTSGALVDNMISKYKNMGGPLFIMLALALVRTRSDSHLVGDELQASVAAGPKILALKKSRVIQRNSAN